MEAISTVIDRNAFAGGPFVEALRTLVLLWGRARYRGRAAPNRCVCSRALEIGPGDEVITVCRSLLPQKRLALLVPNPFS